jgi:hypothetical protein
LHDHKQLSFDAGVDSGKVWKCEVYINNQKLFEQLMEGSNENREWYAVKVNLSSFKDSKIKIRIYQRVLIPGRAAGNAYWKNLKIE